MSFDISIEWLAPLPALLPDYEREKLDAQMPIHKAASGACLRALHDHVGRQVANRTGLVPAHSKIGWPESEW
ncbi:hypothetical protein [Bosea vaviloviae]|uniref:hypothetical protein n=1 Tax=Bosea vaviloviae TaxID=1526658 RepID=UPI0011E040CA|nr:hypothetical protein [Bosea vaviloviae]